MKSLCLVFLAVTAAMAQNSTVHIVDGSAKSKGLQISNDGQLVPVQLRGIQVVIKPSSFSKEKEERGDVLMLFDPKTHLFMWRYHDSGDDGPGDALNEFEQDYTVYLTANKLVVFRFVRPSLWVREWTDRCSTMDQAQSAVLVALQRYGLNTLSVMNGAYQGVNLGESLGYDFLLKRGNAAPFPTALTEVSRQNGQWRAVLKGPNGDSAAVLLTDKYEIVSSAPLK